MAIVFGILTDYVAFRPVREKSVTAVLITSFAFSTLLQNAALLFISPRPRTVPLPEIFSQTVEIAGVITPIRNLITIAVAVVFLGLFTWLMRTTVLGIAMRAAATHFTMARMLGVPANLIISTAFAISGLIAGIVSLLWIGRIGTVVPGIGLEPLLIAFIATVIGGMRSLARCRARRFSPGPDRHQPQLQPAAGSPEIPRRLHLLLGDPDPALAPRRPDQGAGDRPEDLSVGRHAATTFILGSLILALVIIAELLGVRLFDRIATNLCIALVLVLGLQVFMGNSGILSFAHIGFMGIGAYASAVLTIPAQMKGMALPDLYPILADVQLSPYLAMVIGGLVAALVASIVAYPLMRLSDAAAVITSFALLVVLHTVMTHWSAVTNGPRTLFGLPNATKLPLAAGSAIVVLIVAMICSRNPGSACCCAPAGTTRSPLPRSVRISRNCAGRLSSSRPSSPASAGRFGATSSPRFRPKRFT